jgi:hypothetical protein
LNRAAIKVLAAVEPNPKKDQELCAALLYRWYAIALAGARLARASSRTSPGSYIKIFS